MKRVICGRGSDGKSSVLYEGPPAKIFTGEEAGIDPRFRFFDIWVTDGPSTATSDLTIEQSTFGMDLGLGETRFRQLTFPPEEAPQAMHRTNTIDYVTVLSGEIELTMKDGRAVLLEAGDTVVQLGALHQWWNRGNEPCVVTFVQIGVEPMTGDEEMSS